MNEEIDLSTAVASKCDPRLHTHLHNINLTRLSRLPDARLIDRALPNISLIELVPSTTFATKYDALYKRMFHGGERERSDLIVTRLADDFAGSRTGLAPYRIIGLQSTSGEAIAAAHFSVLFLSGSAHAVPYLQYIYVRPENRRQDLSELLHTLVLAVAEADARDEGTGRTVPFTLFETEPPTHGESEQGQATAEERIKIHARSGSLALMLMDRTTRVVVSAHVQPGLEVGDEPLTLIWALRANPGRELVLEGDGMGSAVLAAYYRSLRDEGFPERNIARADNIAGKRQVGRGFVIMALAEVTNAMYVGID